MPPINDHPQRYAIANELHARPFPTLNAPSRALMLAIKNCHKSQEDMRSAARAHLITLLDRFGLAHPNPEATHYFGDFGKFRLKWELHTEFVTYTAFIDGLAERPCDPQDFGVFPEDWINDIPGQRITSALIHIEPRPNQSEMDQRIAALFVPESVVVSNVLDGSATIACDFRIDSAGHIRFAVFASPQANERRLGRIVQRLNEIETYKTMSLLGFRAARDMSPMMNEIDVKLRQIMREMAENGGAADATLGKLLETAAELENLNAQSEFRFGATDAYRKLVAHRIDALREENFEGRQILREFMMRRFDPSMRTVKATQDRLSSMAARAMRAGELLRTQVDVARSAQNQTLLQSMDQRADMQLRLQRTVEGLSVVAISYYAVSLGGHLLYPLASAFGLSKPQVMAAITLPVIFLVWAAVKRIRAKIH